MTCDHLQKKDSCPCSWTHCSRYGKCCECVAFHNGKGELPGCFFTPEAEAVGDRTFEALVKDRQ